MQSKNKAAPTKDEAGHILRIKGMACILCGAPPPSECHEIKQGLWWASVPLCADCHRGSRNGLHGQRFMWKIKKWDEVDALAATIKILVLSHEN